MNCRDTERLWNELLDARDEPRPDLEAALEAHAAACPACADLSSRYGTLRQAIAAWTPPAASPEFAARVVRATGQDGQPSDGVLPFRRPITVPRKAWLSAAAAIVAAGVGLWAVPLGRNDKLADAPTPPPVALSLSDALADATSATLELARDASAPAGRVGRAVLASATLPSAAPPAPEVEVAVGASSEMIQSVGGRVGAGVGPLSGSAQHAFGFLLPSASPDVPEAPPAAPRSGI
jgi:hypothetical protein